MKTKTHIFTLLISVVSLLFLVSPANAIYLASSENLNLPKTQKFDESVAVSGSNLVIDADINGDLYCAGQNIIINGSVKGDVLCVGQKIKVNGPVSGNVRLAGQYLDIASNIDKNLNAFGQNISYLPGFITKGDFISAGQSITLDSSVGRDLLIAGKTLSLSATSKVGRNFDYYSSENQPASFTQSNIKGKVSPHFFPTKTATTVDSPKRIAKPLYFASSVFSFISYLVLGLVSLFIAKTKIVSVATLTQSQPVKTFLIGITALIMVPIVFLIFLITLIGAPLAFLMLILYFLGLLLATVLSSVFVGQMILPKLNYSKSNPYLSFVTGWLAISLVGFIPVLGGFVNFVLFCLGFGSFFYSLTAKQS